MQSKSRLDDHSRPARRSSSRKGIPVANTGRVAVVVGRLRRDSVNRKLAKALAAQAPVPLSLAPVEIGQLALYNQDDDANPPAASVAFRQKIAESDAVLFVTPEYNGRCPES
jgi:chromate reductase, NAD(P)H dehydrogenase (quinone)